MEKKLQQKDLTGEVGDIKLRWQAKGQMRLKYLKFSKQSKKCMAIYIVGNCRLDTCKKI